MNFTIFKMLYSACQNPVLIDIVEINEILIFPLELLNYVFHS